MKSQHEAGEYFDTSPQSDQPLDSSWREAYSYHDTPLVLKTGDRKITMTFDDLLDNDHKIKIRADDDNRASIARAKIANIMCE